MYFVLYDREFNSIGESYLLESWSRVQRALDFDDMSIVGEKIPYSAEPFFVVVNDRQGKLQFSGLASTPVIDEQTQKTSIILKDYTTLWNTEILFSWGSFSDYPPEEWTLERVILDLFIYWGEQNDYDINVDFDTSRLSRISWDQDYLDFSNAGGDPQIVNLYDVMHDILMYYDIYVTANLDVYNKKLWFEFYPIHKTDVMTIRLRDFGVPKIEKEFGDFSRVSIYSHDRSVWRYLCLTENNTIVDYFAPDFSGRSNLVYPAKQRIFIAEEPSKDPEDPEGLTPQQAMWNATYDALMALAANRYQINIDLDFQQYSSILDASKLNFSTTVAVYTDEGFYKNLPVGEIETDSNGKHIIRLGYRVQELTQEV